LIGLDFLTNILKEPLRKEQGKDALVEKNGWGGIRGKKGTKRVFDFFTILNLGCRQKPFCSE
jgi:hypothetical protein